MFDLDRRYGAGFDLEYGFYIDSSPPMISIASSSSVGMPIRVEIGERRGLAVDSGVVPLGKGLSAGGAGRQRGDAAEDGRGRTGKDFCCGGAPDRKSVV